MADKNTATLLSLYVTLYTEKYGRKPLINRYKDQWGVKDMITDLGLKEARALMVYYFECPTTGHPLLYLFRNYEKLQEIKTEQENDREARIALREATRKRVEEWDKKYGEQ